MSLHLAFTFTFGPFILVFSTVSLPLNEACVPESQHSVSSFLENTTQTFAAVEKGQCRVG